jgi:TldD protein
MNPLMHRALNTAEHKGAQYSDIRIVNYLTETISVKDGVPETVSQCETMGFGVRTLVDGAWGFASSDRLSEDEIDRVTGLAIETALASALVASERTALGEAVTSQGSYQTPVQLDPFKISLADKLGLLLAAAEMYGNIACRAPAIQLACFNFTGVSA